MFSTAAAPLPYYSSHGFAATSRPSSSRRNGPAEPMGAGIEESPASPLSPTRSHASEAHEDVTDTFGPAVEGPPSPQRIRALSHQMKTTSESDTSAPSSSLSTVQDRPSWENTVEQVTLSRRSSTRSTSSSMPSKERPESVQLFGKTIFNRRAKPRRESSANSSAESSLYSGDASMEPQSAKEPYVPSLFGRMAGNRQRSSSTSKKLQISQPYNFQHVTHTRRDHVSKSSLGNQSDAGFDMVTSPIDGLSPSASQATIYELEDPEELRSPVANADEVTPWEKYTPTSPISSGTPSISPQRLSIHPRRFMKRTVSSEQLRINTPRSAAAPPRPPRSPVEQSSFGPPVPPPRMSSRASTAGEPLATTTLDRPQTSGGFRHPQPFSPWEAADPPATAIGYVAEENREDVEAASPASSFSHALTTPDDAAWPLSSNGGSFPFEAAPLPDVPEEDESLGGAARRSRMSLASNCSSLRASQSVPMLRQSVHRPQSPTLQTQAQAQAQAANIQRPPSGASDTIGRFDMVATQRALKAAACGGEDAEDFLREDWEDDIDYCYEHAAEADCDYKWDRPSVDMSRDYDIGSPYDEDNIYDSEDTSPEKPSMASNYQDENHQSAGLRPVPARHFDIPALSPMSPVSMSHAHEAVTPTLPSLPSHGRSATEQSVRTRSKKPSHLHVRTESEESNYKESYGFNLSPSLLIPGDFHHQMLMAKSRGESLSDDFLSPDHAYTAFGDASPVAMSTPGLYTHDRTSTSTTGSASTTQTDITTDRHISSSSNFTSVTRYTGSTTYEDWSSKSFESSGPVPPVQCDKFPEMGSASHKKTPVPEADAVVSSEENIAAAPDASPLASSLKENSTKAMPQRHRAHTTSLSTPAGGYALFPPAYTGNRNVV